MRNKCHLRLCEFWNSDIVYMKKTSFYVRRSPESADPTGTSSGIPNIVVHVYDEAKKSK